MDAPDNEPWFYSREGVQAGPVTFEELRRKSQAGELNPRLDLVWRQGMPDWKPAGEVEGLFERRSSSEPATTASSVAGSTASPYAPPRRESGAESMASPGEWPGLRRRWYLLGAIGFPLLVGVGLAILDHLEIALEPAVRIAIESVLVSIVSLYVTIQRFPNLGMSRWWTLGLVVPFLNIWLGYRLFACPAGYEYDRKLDPAGITLAVIYWLIILIVAVVLIFFIAVLAGVAGNPEMLEAIQEVLREAYPDLPVQE